MALPLAWSSSIRKGDGLFNSPNSLTQKRRADRRRTPGTTREVRLLAQGCKRGWKRLAVRKRTAKRFRFFTTSRPVCGANRVDSSQSLKAFSILAGRSRLGCAKDKDATKAARPRISACGTGLGAEINRRWQW